VVKSATNHPDLITVLFTVVRTLVGADEYFSTGQSLLTAFYGLSILISIICTHT